MSNEPKHKRLLADVLAEQSDRDFRDAMLGQTLRLARRRRVVRKTRRAAVSCALIAGLIVIGSHLRLPDRPRLVPAPRSYTLVETQPLAPTATIVTANQPIATLITTTPLATVVTTDSANFEFHQLTDDELLALAPAESLLIRHPDHSAELLFPDAVGDALPH